MGLLPWNDPGLIVVAEHSVRFAGSGGSVGKDGNVGPDEGGADQVFDVVVEYLLLVRFFSIYATKSTR